MLAATAIPHAARAQDRSAQDIIVTARREAERWVDVPLVIDVVQSDRITTGGIDDLQSLSAKIPGLSFEAGWGGFFATPAMRGQNSPNPRMMDSVGMFIDGVYQANRDAVDADMLDLERIEVVQGPQSALFGHSSFSGLIHFVPAEPTEQRQLGASADLGSDGVFGLRAMASGPIDPMIKARIAASWKTEGGTQRNGAQSDQKLDSRESFAIAASIATRDAIGPVRARLSGRFTQTWSSQPAVFTLDHRSYNCGTRDPGSGAWSYYCGQAPIPPRVSVSPENPDSRTRTGQLALHLALDWGGVEVLTDTSYYQAVAREFRDFDGGADGEIYGVCIAGVNCNGVGSLVIPVVRLQPVNMVLRRSVAAREIAQELRLRGVEDRALDWQIGGALIWSRVRTTMAWGAARGALGTNERFSSLDLANPQRVGAPAAINFAVVDDPSADQVVQSDAIEARRTIALFGAVNYRLSETVRLRGEVRFNWERLILDSRTANFAASFGTSLGARTFYDVTPRLGIEWRPATGWLLYASYAKGSRSGGINALPNLIPAEQAYEPESNWTTELGVKYNSTGLVRAARLIAYDIDWRNAQILGFSATQGINALIVRNTVGIRTRGIEFAAELEPTNWLQFAFAYSYARPRFKAGSEDPGGGGFCGLSPSVTVSDLCLVRPSQINPGQLVPDISGNVPGRALGVSWTIGLTASPPVPALAGLSLHADLNHQGDVFDNNLNGLRWGARTLIDARVSVVVRPGLSLDLWGTNLGDARYVRYAAPRAPAFYVGIPRPTDLILGEGRRIGLTLRYLH